MKRMECQKGRKKVKIIPIRSKMAKNLNESNKISKFVSKIIEAINLLNNFTMRKLAVILILVTGFSGAFAQKGKITSAMNYMNNGQIEKAWEAIQEAEKNEKTINYYKTYYAKGKILQTIAESGDENIKKLVEDPLPKAYASYKKAIELDEKGKVGKQVDFELTMLNNDFINLGVQKYQDKDNAGALEAFEYSLEIGKSEIFGGVVDTSIVFNAGLAAYNGKMNDKAIKYFTIAKDMGYGGSTVYQLIDRVYLSQNDSANAEKIMQEGVEAFPEEDVLMVELINYYLTSDQDDKAFEYLNVAKEKDPENKTYWYVEGVLYDKKMMMDEALKSYGKATELDPEYYDPLYNMGVIYFNNGVKLQEKANEIMDNAKFAIAKAKADEEFAKSVPNFEKALEVAPDDKKKIEAMENLKVLYYRLKMMDKREEIIKQLDELGNK